MTERDVCERYHGGQQESRAAFVSIPTAMKQRTRQMILSHITKSGGATCDECEVALQLPHQTCSARITELIRDGLIVDSQKKRKTRSGRNARILVSGGQAELFKRENSASS